MMIKWSSEKKMAILTLKMVFWSPKSNPKPDICHPNPKKFSKPEPKFCLTDTSLMSIGTKDGN